AVAAALALALGRRASTRIVGPLARLRAAVAGLRADAPDPQRLGPLEGYEEVDALRAALADLLTRHGAALAQSRRFAADAAHELRTPLTMMQAELELAAEREDLPAGVAASLARVRSTLGVLSSLSEHLLILAAPLDRVRLDRDAVALSDVVREAIAALDPPRRARVASELDDDAVVRGDATLLRALIDNALDNALKFAPAGAVTVRVSREPDAAVLRVVDEGPGVAPGQRERVFEPFYRTAAARAGATRGHGVGLALIAHVARAHGGDARFEDATRGASLRVTLPPWRASDAA
ncbi:MAG: HAMP domain-containing histidine kinase, partial [Deltaproteobacteria bacterium]|nr:HAMP domain-containing histidine kinase [Deltaproteobacteria bacterium]